MSGSKDDQDDCMKPPCRKTVGLIWIQITVGICQLISSAPRRAPYKRPLQKLNLDFGAPTTREQKSTLCYYLIIITILAREIMSKLTLPALVLVLIFYTDFQLVEVGARMSDDMIHKTQLSDSQAYKHLVSTFFKSSTHHIVFTLFQPIYPGIKWNVSLRF